MWYNVDMHKRGKKEGFTLIELSLSIAFIAVLSLAVALIITNSISAYHRGLVLNQINTVGMELVDDMRAAVQNAPVVSLKSLCDSIFEDNSDGCKNSNGQNLVAVRKHANVMIGSTEEKDIPVAGAFCTGNYSYIWNTGYYYSEDAEVDSNVKKATFKYLNVNGDLDEYPKGDDKDIRLLKIKDEKRSVCAVYDDTSDNNVFDITDKDKFDVVTEDPIELLSDESNLALYDLYAPAPAVNAGMNNIYYSVSFVLGTLQGGADVAAQGSYCATPEGLDNSAIENFDYCAINKFNFAAQAIGGGE